MSSAAKWGAYFAKVKEVQPEIIHFHCYAPDLAPLLWFAKRAGLKTVHSEHWSGFLLHHPRPLQGWRRALARWYMSNCHLVLPVSPIHPQAFTSGVLLRIQFPPGGSLGYSSRWQQRIAVSIPHIEFDDDVRRVVDTRSFIQRFTGRNPTDRAMSIDLPIQQ